MPASSVGSWCLLTLLSNLIGREVDLSSHEIARDLGVWRALHWEVVESGRARGELGSMRRAPAGPREKNPLLGLRGKLWFGWGRLPNLEVLCSFSTWVTFQQYPLSYPEALAAAEEKREGTLCAASPCVSDRRVAKS